jgi:hypothetical protein
VFSLGDAQGRPCGPLVCAILAVACATLPVPAETKPQEAGRLFGDTYPIEVSISFHKAFLHWMDSLAMLAGHGFTGGKTVEAHRRQFEVVLGGLPTRKDVEMLKRYHAVRSGYVRQSDPERRNRLTLAFLEASSLDDALERAAGLLETNSARALAGSMRHFMPLYRQIWKDGEVPRSFLARARNFERREELASLLAEVARFYGVSPGQDPRPELVLVPVPPGFGTHAQAIESFLLIEIRNGEALIDEVAPIVHENAHFMYRKIPESRREELEQTALAERRGPDAWPLLTEALPTAIAQGVADQTFREDWSTVRPWYHDESVDRYAKRIFPLVRDALRDGGSLDRAFVKKLVSAYEHRKSTRE